MEIKSQPAQSGLNSQDASNAWVEKRRGLGKSWWICEEAIHSDGFSASLRIDSQAGGWLACWWSIGGGSSSHNLVQRASSIKITPGGGWGALLPLPPPWLFSPAWISSFRAILPHPIAPFNPFTPSTPVSPLSQCEKVMLSSSYCQLLLLTTTNCAPPQPQKKCP